jgi:hypothetical protein
MSPADAAAAREFVRALVATAYDGEPRERLMEAWRKVRGKPWAFEPPPESDRASRRPIWRATARPSKCFTSRAPATRFA